MPARGAEVMRVAGKEGRLDLAEVLKLLASRGVTRLMIEGGPTVASALIEADLIDEAIFFHAQMVIGKDGVPALQPRAFAMLERHLKHISSEAVGPDRQETYQRESRDV
jgi:diaminohydroxyphosphoribosylaminopyrimidine deaminase/5-amino-6-(5-phosphoribosylamino)uracil reductase